MDLRMFYQKLRQVEATITQPHAVVVSNETPDGGRAGVTTEVSRDRAARLLVEGRARLATDEEAGRHHAERAEVKRIADQLASAGKMHITVVSETDLRALKGALRPEKR